MYGLDSRDSGMGTTEHSMRTNAIIFRKPGDLQVEDLGITPPGAGEIVVETLWSGISSGTERMLLEGTMPPFPGMGYPLVPGYESVGRVTRSADNGTGPQVDDLVFVPGARGYIDARGLFGATASLLVADAAKVVSLPETLGEEGALLALAATAHHALALAGSTPPQLIVGHGVLGRLIARISIALGNPAPTVWESSGIRRGDAPYPVIDGADDSRTDYASIMDASGDPGILDTAIAHLAKGGEIVLAGFYSQSLSFAFPPAFMREARFRVAAEFDRFDIDAVLALLTSGRLSLDGLITHRAAPQDAKSAYDTAFNDPTCLKMILDWRNCS